jgi:hypothetical protein
MGRGSHLKMRVFGVKDAKHCPGSTIVDVEEIHRYGRASIPSTKQVGLQKTQGGPKHRAQRTVGCGSVYCTRKYDECMARIISELVPQQHSIRRSFCELPEIWCESSAETV